MGNKIITEKDFWVCSMGNIPSTLQGTKEGLKKEVGGELYITVENKATVAIGDFGCKQYWKLAALAAVAAIVVGVIVIGTGGLALIAVGFIAGVTYATTRAIVGALLCGHKLESKRSWLQSKKDMKIQSIHAITGDCVMVCTVGGRITYDPTIKTWAQAYARAGANYLGDILEFGFKGACLGALGAGIAYLASGAATTALSELFAGGVWQGLGQGARMLGTNIARNYASTWGVQIARTTAGQLTFGLLETKTLIFMTVLRGSMATQGALQEFSELERVENPETGEIEFAEGVNPVSQTLGGAGRGLFGMEIGTAHSAHNLVSFDENGNYNGSIWDVGAIALWMLGNGRLPIVERGGAPGVTENNVKGEAYEGKGKVEVTEEALEYASKSKNASKDLAQLKNTAERLADNGFDVEIKGEGVKSGELTLSKEDFGMDIPAESKHLMSNSQRAVQTAIRQGTKQVGDGGTTVIDGGSSGTSVETFEAGFESFKRTSVPARIENGNAGASGQIIFIDNNGGINIYNF